MKFNIFGLKQKNVELTPDHAGDLFNTYQLGKNIDYDDEIKNIAELFSVLNYKSNTFATGELTKGVGLPHFWNTNRQITLTEIYDKINYNYSLYGIAYLYVKGGAKDPISVRVLDNENVNVELYSNKNILNVDNYEDGIRVFKYTNNGITIELDPKEIITVVDKLGTPFYPVSKVTKLTQKLNNVVKGEKALGTTLDRSGMYLLTKQPATLNSISGALNNDNVINEGNRKFKKDHTILEKDLIILNSPFNVQSLTYDANLLRVQETLLDAFKSICMVYGVPYDLFDSKTTFNNQQEIYNHFMDNTIKREADVFVGSLNRYFGVDDYVMDYSNAITYKKEENNINLQTTE